MRRLLLAASALVLLAAVPACAAQPTASAIRQGDADLDHAITPILVQIGYVDANLDGRITAAQPDEPVYLDFDHDGTVSFGDLRLTGFGTYASGTLVDLANRDFGLKLTLPSGWFATGPDGGLYIDHDLSGTVSAGDVRLSGADGGQKALATDADAGARLAALQGDVSPNSRVGVEDANRNGRADPGEAVFLDVDGQSYVGGRRVTVGDWRIERAGLATDDVVTHADLDAVAAGQYTPANGAAPAAVQAPTWRTLDWILVAIAAINLAGLVAALRALQVRSRNPFK